ncbi:MAG: pseudouridine-5'-phosphate glycosidase [Gemmatimonadales bacterium]
MRFHPDVAAARRGGRPVVALETSVLAQGLPSPANRESVARVRSAILARGAVPALTAVVRGTPTIGLGDEDLERFLGPSRIPKVSARDLPWAIAHGTDGATTVAASLTLCVRAGLEVFATGGIGGVHRDAPYDESADLIELSRSPVVVVCAGAKAILDVRATLERLETLGVSVVGYRTAEFPAFFSARSGLPVPAVAESPAEIADVYRAMRALGRPAALLVVRPPPRESALEPALVEEAVAAALLVAREEGVRGGAVTPYLLEAVDRATAGRSRVANLALLEANAALAAEIACALAGRGG